MPSPVRLVVCLAFLTLAQSVLGQDDAPASRAPALTQEMLRALPLRPLGPGITPGRIGDIAVDPRDKSTWYVAVASGGVWKTTNRGITWTSIFDNYGSYSIGCLALDPKNPDIVWVGTGENQSQRSVGFGDGLYKSTDAGKTFKRVGLENSEHIAKVLIHPTETNTVYVACQGPLWSPGGDRGLYKTMDGGKTWENILEISKDTGVTDVHFDPRDPNVLYAASYQRRRHVGVLIGGGPEAKIFKSTDAGKTWTKLTKGLPEFDLGRIALAVSPQKPDVIYAHLQTAAKERGAFYRSEDGGQTWEKRSVAPIQDGQYYGEIYCDPHKFDRVYILDMQVQISDDGGKSFRRQRWSVHVDHHAIWFDPDDERHILSGNDGGLYETFDGGQTWRHFTNMSTVQYYRIAVDNAAPFYNVYGGAQDNGTSGGPTRTANRLGIRTSDWGVFGGGDGFQARVDPEDPNIVYTQSQNGSLSRLDRTTGQSRGIRPRAEKGKGARVRWHWDSPLIISPHKASRIYFGGSVLYRSDDRGDNWKAVSPDLTRNLDRDKIEVMGKVWGPDAVSRNTFTTALSVATSVAESPAKEGVLIVGTDDGLVQISTDGGENWQKSERFPGVAEYTYVTDVEPSHHDADTFYVALNDYQRGNFRPYLQMTTDGGKSWKSIAGDLPDRHPVWSVLEDPVNKNLLFAGTEFGLFVSINGGQNWTRFEELPTVMFRDLHIQSREGDLVCGTFGRGVYVLDDYTPLRHLAEAAEAEGTLFPVRKTLAVSELPFARSDAQFTAPNPPDGAALSYFLPKAIEGDSKLVLRVAGPDGKTLRDLSASRSAGLHRVYWDLRASRGGDDGERGGKGGKGGKGPKGGGRRFGGGPIVKPGHYTVTLVKLTGEKAAPLGKPQTFEVLPFPSSATTVTRP